MNSTPRFFEVALPLSESMSTITTFAPFSRKALVVSKPMPRAPPVTTATLPSKEVKGEYCIRLVLIGVQVGFQCSRLNLVVTRSSDLRKHHRTVSDTQSLPS